jgi:hypothetical protein
MRYGNSALHGVDEDGALRLNQPKVARGKLIAVVCADREYLAAASPAM